jgi:hypothetical protein
MAENDHNSAPERIWLTGFAKDQYGARLGRGTVSDLDHGVEYPEYVRADLPPTPEQIASDQRVRALVEAAQRMHDLSCGDGSPAEWEAATLDLRAAIAAFREEGGE